MIYYASPDKPTGGYFASTIKRRQEDFLDERNNVLLLTDEVECE